MQILQRCNRDIQHESLTGSCGRMNLVDVANLFEAPAVVAQHLPERISEVFRKQILNSLAKRLIASEAENKFQG